MKSAYVLSFLVVSLMYLAVSCTTLGNGKAQKAQETAQDKLTSIQTKIDENANSKLEQAAVFAAGTDYALNKIPEPTKEVEIAKDMNQRVVSITGTPAIDELKRVYGIVDGLLSQIKTERDTAKNMLDLKDSEISIIQAKGKALEKSLRVELENYKKLNVELAKKADAVANEYGEFKGDMNSFMGLGAIWYGLKTLVVKLMWILGSITILYILLRVFASAHPAIGAVFSIFDVIGSLALNLIKGLAPGAVKFSKLIPTQVFDGYKKTLKKIVDKIQLLKSHEVATGKNGNSKTYTLQELLDEFSKEFGDDDKNLIDKLKSELSWK